MRQIKFRGLRTDGKGWVYGVPFYISGERKCFIIDNCQSGNLTQEDSVFDGKEVEYRSVGQFTGLKDKNGVEIYEGDRVRHNDNIFVVKYSENQHVLLLRVENDKSMNWRSLQWLAKVSKYCKVIGSIHTQDGGQGE